MVQRIINPLPRLAVRYDFICPQNAKVMRNKILRQAEPFKNVADALFPGRQMADYPEADIVT